MPPLEYLATTPTLSDGQSSGAMADVNSNLKITQATSQAGEDIPNDVQKVEQRFSANYISTATTTTVRTGVGVLHSITITESVASTIIVYDNTAASGTILASFVASAAVGTYTFDVAYTIGLTIITAGASKLTVSYR